MCELVVLLKDPELSGNPRLDNQCLRLGEVICVVEDGHEWTPRERSNPDWQILQVPGMTLTEGLSLVAEEGANVRKQRGPAIRYPRKRLYQIDLTDIVVGDGRSADVVRLETAFLKDRVVKKPPAEDPDVLG